MTKAGHRKLAAAGATLAALLQSGSAGAASQGALAAASRGSITITVSLREPARVAGLSDLSIDGATVAQDLCFRGAARGFTVAAAGGGPDGGLTLSNGDERLAYRVEWQPRAGGLLEVSTGDAIGRADCSLGSGRLAIALDPAAAERVRAGAPYAGTLVLTLVPE